MFSNVTYLSVGGWCVGRDAAQTYSFINTVLVLVVREASQTNLLDF